MVNLALHMSYEEPVAEFMCVSIIERLIWQLAFHRRSELYCGLNDCLTVCFSSLFYFVVRVRCRRKKFTFAISSADEFLVCIYLHWNTGQINRSNNEQSVWKRHGRNLVGQLTLSGIWKNTYFLSSQQLGKSRLRTLRGRVNNMSQR